jgi:hypothetical protein
MASPTLTVPQAHQKRYFPRSLKRVCPTCNAKAGEPCMPSSLSIPHLARCRDDKNGEAA